jgi:hypothetical protein
MFKWAFWLGLIAAGIFVGGQVIPVHYNNMKIQNVFEGVVSGLADKSEEDIRDRINELFRVQTVDMTILPKEFYENLTVTRENDKLQVFTDYHVTIWLLDRPRSVNPDGEYKASDAKGMDKLRLKARLDFDFSPFAESN